MSPRNPEDGNPSEQTSSEQQASGRRERRTQEVTKNFSFDGADITATLMPAVYQAGGGWGTPEFFRINARNAEGKDLIEKLDLKNHFGSTPHEDEHVLTQILQNFGADLGENFLEAAAYSSHRPGEDRESLEIHLYYEKNMPKFESDSKITEEKQ